MMRTLAVVISMVAAGCGGSADDCQRFVDKASPWFEKMAQSSGGRSFGDAERKQVVEMCRKQPKTKASPEFKCVLGAKDDAAVAACFESAFKDYMGKAKQTEAALQLNKLAKYAKVYWAENSAFPTGKVGPSPATPCCDGPGHKCPVGDWGKDPAWQALDFQIDEPHQFQYTYESDGQAAKATAIGDLDCDGTTITYTLDLTVANGAVEAKITKPTTED